MTTRLINKLNKVNGYNIVLENIVYNQYFEIVPNYPKAAPFPILERLNVSTALAHLSNRLHQNLSPGSQSCFVTRVCNGTQHHISKVASVLLQSMFLYYSRTSRKRTPHGTRKSVRLREVATYGRLKCSVCM